MGLVGLPTCQHDEAPSSLRHGCRWHGHQHQADDPQGHGEVQQRRNVLGGGEHDGLQAGSVQGYGGVQQVRPVQHPACTLQQPLHHPARRCQQPVDERPSLTCVLTKMDMLGSSLQVNLKAYTTDIWQQMNLKKTLAGEDPEWRQKMISGYTDCYQVASNWPQQSLDRNPITKVFGRHMIFFKCAMKQEKKMCGMAQMYSWLTTLYGNSDDFNWSQFGLPTDKYDRAALTIMVQTEAASKEDKFVNDFFINDEL